MSTSNLIPSRICNNPWSRLSLASLHFPTGTLCSRLGLSTGACAFGTTVTLGDRLLIGSFDLSAGTLTWILIGHYFFSSVYEIIWRAKLCASLIINSLFYHLSYQQRFCSCLSCKPSAGTHIKVTDTDEIEQLEPSMMRACNKCKGEGQVRARR